MKPILAIVASATLVTALSAQQQPPQELKNVRLLKGMSRSQLVRTMQFMAASLGVSCDFCHAVKPDGEGNFASDEKEEKRTARDMIRLVIDSNAQFFHGRPEVTCNTCHRGSTRPAGSPVLPVAMPKGEPEDDEKKSVLPTRNEIVAKYAKALGTVDEKALASMELKGVRETARGTGPFDVFIAPGKVRVTSTTPEGEMVSVVTGSTGWMRDARGTRPMQGPQVETTLQTVEAYGLTWPSKIPADARVSRARVRDRDTWVLTMPFRTKGRQRLYFDAETSLLLRRLTMTPTAIGNIPQQTDFEDYRDAGGMRMPFVVRIDTIDPRGGATRRYTDIRLNAEVDGRLFEP